MIGFSPRAYDLPLQGVLTLSGTRHKLHPCRVGILFNQRVVGLSYYSCNNFFKWTCLSKPVITANHRIYSWVDSLVFFFITLQTDFITANILINLFIFTHNPLFICHFRLRFFIKHIDIQTNYTLIPYINRIFQSSFIERI